MIENESEENQRSERSERNKGTGEPERREIKAGSEGGIQSSPRTPIRSVTTRCNVWELIESENQTHERV